jgi:hypothetical protein
MFSKSVTEPLAQGFCRSPALGGRVDGEEKSPNDNTLILLETGCFLKREGVGCG